MEKERDRERERNKEGGRVMGEMMMMMIRCGKMSLKVKG